MGSKQIWILGSRDLPIEITPMTNMVSENDTGEWFDDMCMQ